MRAHRVREQHDEHGRGSARELRRVVGFAHALDEAKQQLSDSMRACRGWRIGHDALERAHALVAVVGGETRGPGIRHGAVERAGAPATVVRGHLVNYSFHGVLVTVVSNSHACAPSKFGPNCCGPLP